MPDQNSSLQHLQSRLEQLSQQHALFAQEIRELKIQLAQFKNTEEISHENPPLNQDTAVQIQEKQVQEPQILVKTQETPTFKLPKKSIEKTQTSPPSLLPAFNLEKFIGENLINKIGILILIIGVAIGAKYSIEHQLLSPLTRILMGYLTGFVLLAVGFKLKEKYESYSAVLVSGSIAISYFITFFAYNFYHLLPQIPAFGVMVLLTVFAVFVAIKYNQQVIAHIGLVGAYAVPFLLSNNTGNVQFLFTYIAMINIGILAISFKVYWKTLYYSAMTFTWLIFSAWFAKDYLDRDFTMAWTFSILYFATFYTMFLCYKLIKNEQFAKRDISLVLSNSFVFFGLGCSILWQDSNLRDSLGLFALGNALFHAIIAGLIFQKKNADKNLIYLISGLALSFVSIAIPIQYSGSSIMLLWLAQAVVVFWIGRVKEVGFYEKISYPLFILSFLSLADIWMSLQSTDSFMPLWNAPFFCSLIFSMTMAYVLFLTHKKPLANPLFDSNTLNIACKYFTPIFLLFAIYFTFSSEISKYYAHHFQSLSHCYKELWLINYTLAFWFVLSQINFKWIKNIRFAWLNLIFALGTIFTFFINGLNNIDIVHDDLIRYLSFIFVGFSLASLAQFYKQVFLEPLSSRIRIGLDSVIHVSILIISTYEIIYSFYLNSTLLISLFWGLYALGLISFGIWKQKQHLRIGALILFSATLLKLFFVDIADMDTLPKTAVFVALGILLLIISFLYNKFKGMIEK
jgi:uncharacterized membrane protein